MMLRDMYRGLCGYPAQPNHIANHDVKVFLGLVTISGSSIHMSFPMVLRGCTEHPIHSAIDLYIQYYSFFSIPLGLFSCPRLATLVSIFLLTNTITINIT
ncbi:hypothetical protein F4781DRAFT_404149 [Annulohypoxylon bovei var. microspora]|nr:hypothetical protein F4781DRAFT_404149 [Annulohypoxylon bovei var. microspora]